MKGATPKTDGLVLASGTVQSICDGLNLVCVHSVPTGEVPHLMKTYLWQTSLT